MACNHPEGAGIAVASVPEFFSLVTHPKGSPRPSKADQALDFLTQLESSGGLRVCLPKQAFHQRLVALAKDLGVIANRIFELQIAPTGLFGGATQLWTHDQGFVKVPGLALVDPLEG